MYLRKLSKKDADRMLLWMHDSEINQFFRFSGETKMIEDILDFIKYSDNYQNIHRAITNESDFYMGTVSLKNIDMLNKSAEYAIVTIREAHGKGYSKFATEEIMKIAFKELGLHRVYLNVFTDNEGAIRFYEKYGFSYEGESRDSVFMPKTNKFKSLKWYSMLSSDICLY